jgi:hypothetical protein
MKIIKNVFDSAQLPFVFIDFPLPDQPPRERKLHQGFIVNIFATPLMTEALRHGRLVETRSTLDWNLAIGRRFSDHQFSVFRP